MQKTIYTRMGGRCKLCGEKIPAGERVTWHGSGRGISHHPTCKETPDAKPVPRKDKETTYQIDYGRLRDFYIAAVDKVKTPAEMLQRQVNRARLAEKVTAYLKNDAFYSASAAEMKTWIAQGFHVPGIENANPDLVPVRDRRKLKFSEDGELQVDLALSGFDYPFLEWEKRERKPGMRLDIGISFSSNVGSALISQYQRWIAQAITTLEESGYDLEVNLTNRVRDSWMGQPGIERTMIRVKRENEALDFAEWSALFSPGGFRHLMFTAKLIGADETGYDLASHYGYTIPEAFSVSMDQETRTLTVTNHPEPSSFPEAQLTQDFLKVIQNQT